MKRRDRKDGRAGLVRVCGLLLGLGLAAAGCASSGDVDQVRKEREQAKARLRAELQQERDLAASMEKESEARKASADKLALALGGTAGGAKVASKLGAAGCPSYSNALAVQVVNDSGLADSQVYGLLTGSGIGWAAGGAPSGLAYLDIAANPTGSMQAAALGGMTPCGTITSAYTGKTRNVYQFGVGAISSGRLMVSYASPVAVSNGNFPTATGMNVRWDKMEFGYPNSGADLTSMDFFGIPMQFDYLDANGSVLDTMTYYTSTPTLLSALYQLSPAMGLSTGAFQQIGGGGTPTYGWAPADGLTNFARVLSPPTIAAGSTTGSPAPYPSFGAYLAKLNAQTQPAFTVSGAGNAGCPNPVGYTYSASFASDGHGGYAVTLTSTSSMTNGPPCGMPPAATTAQGTAVLSGSNTVKSVIVTNPGSDYFSSAPTVTFTGGGGSGAQGTAILSSSGTVRSVIITNAGSGYTAAPGVTFSSPPTPPSNVTLPPNLTVTVNLPAPSTKAGYDVNLYGAPATAFTVSGATLSPSQQSAIPNSLYAVIAGDFMAGMNFGYAGSGSTAPQNTASWYSNPPTLYPFAGARKTNDGYYNPFAAVFYNLSDAYGFAYSDRGGRPSPYVPLPGNATTMRITLLNDRRLDAPMVTVSNATSSSLQITWPASAGATGYAVNVTYGGGIPVTGVTLNPPTPSPSGTTISGLSPGTTYQIRVTATGANSTQSYAVPVYGTTSGQMAQPTGTVPFGTSLNWSANTSGTLPAGYTISINNSSYTPGKANAPVSGSSGPNIYGVTVANGSSTIYQGNYIVNLTPTSNQVAGVTMTTLGSGYASAPTVTFSGGGGSGATGVANIANHQVTCITITNPGSGYTSAPTVTFSGGGGSGAAGTAVIGGFAVQSAFLTPPNSKSLTTGWSCGGANSFPTGPFLNNGSLVIGTPFAPVATKQAGQVVFPTP